MSEATKFGHQLVALADPTTGIPYSATGGGGGGAVTVADGADVTQGAKADAAWDGLAASATAIAILKKIATSGAAAGLTDTQLRATPVPVSGAFFQATQPVSIAAPVAVTGTFWQATQPVSNVFDLAGGAAVTIATQPVAMIGARTAGATATALQAMADNVDAIAVSGIGNTLRVAGLGYQFNGTTWDRLRGDATNGLKVQGTFFQATQPVSIAATVAVSGPLTDTQLRASAVPTDPSDRAARLLGVVASITNPVAVTGAFFQATQPVSGTVTANQGTANTAANAWFTKLTDGTNTAAVKAASTTAAATDPALVMQLHPSSNPVKIWDGSIAASVKAASTLALATDTAVVVTHHPSRPDASTLAVTATGLSAAAVTLTLPAAAAGLFHYITSIQIVAFATVLRTAAATPVLVTTTNLPGTPAFSFKANAMALGDSEIQTLIPTTPLKSSVAATATTIVCPATTAVLWRVNVTYYTAP